MSQHERIPEDPRENLARMKSILAGYRRKLEHKKKVKESTESKLARLREAMVGDEDSDTKEANSRKVIERKYIYDLDNLQADVKELEGKIIWAEKRQIPFIESEIELYEAAQDDGEADEEVAVAEAGAAE